MNYMSAEKERITRFYYWALTDFEREIDENYPLVSTVHSLEVVNFFRATEGLTKDELLLLSRALVKTNHPAALILVNERVSSKENYELIRYRSRLLQLQNERRLSLATTILEPPARFRSKTVTDAILYDPELSLFVARKGTSPCFISQINLWNVKTHFRYNHMMRSVEYWHSIYRRDGKGLSVPEFGNGLETHMTSDLLSWLGVGRTAWPLEAEANIAQISNSLSIITQHYLVAIDAIVSSLG